MYRRRQRAIRVMLFVAKLATQVLVAVTALAVGLSACSTSGTETATVAGGPSAAARSSGRLANSGFSSAAAGPNADAGFGSAAAGPNATAGSSSTTTGAGSAAARAAGRPDDARSGAPSGSQPESQSGGASISGRGAEPEGRSAGPSESDSQPGAGSGPGAETQPGGSGDPRDPAAQPDEETVGGASFVPTPRPDGIELAYADGTIGPIVLGSTIDEIASQLGPLYQITPEESIRVDFPAGYSIARDGHVLFWAIEEDGRITVLMTSSPLVGLESGLRPKLPLADAIALHGEPMLTLRSEGREFAAFADGTGQGGTVSVLVAIGEFGGPVGVYEAGPESNIGSETVVYQRENANIKELWFWAGSQPESPAPAP